MDPVNVESLDGWIPVRVRAHEPAVEWAVLNEPLTAPFFEQTVDRAMHRPFNGVFARVTPLETLDALADVAEPVVPAGVILHMSRCGSTLITQLLSRIRGVAALSEPQPLDAVLRLRGRAPGGDATIVRYLRGLVHAFASALPQRRIVLKFNASHALLLPLIAEAWPAAPRLFVFREPREVLRSQRRSSGPELFPGAIDPQLLCFHDPPTDISEYGARTLAAFCEAALGDSSSPRMLFVDHASLPDAVFTRIAPHFGIVLSDEDRDAMRAITALDVKANVIRPEAEDDALAIESIDRLAVRWLDEPFARLRARTVTPAAAER